MNPALWETDLLTLLRGGYRVDEAWRFIQQKYGEAAPGIHAALRAQTRFRKAGLLRGVTVAETLTVPSVFPTSTPDPLRKTGDDWAFIADLHFPLVDWLFLARCAQVLRKLGIRHVTFQGDINNQEYYSTHPRILAEAGLDVESDVAQRGMDLILQEIDEAVLLLGNHDRRILKRLMGVPEATAKANILSLIGGDRGGRVEVSVLDYHYLETSRGPWIVAHGEQYSSHPGKTAADLALDEGMNAITAHEHHLALTTDRTGRFVAIANGMMADPRKLHYVNLVKRGGRRRMVQGFTVLKGGVPRLFAGENAPKAFSDWSLLEGVA